MDVIIGKSVHFIRKSKSSQISSFKQGTIGKGKIEEASIMSSSKGKKKIEEMGLGYLVESGQFI